MKPINIANTCCLDAPSRSAISMTMIKSQLELLLNFAALALTYLAFLKWDLLVATTLGTSAGASSAENDSHGKLHEYDNTRCLPSSTS